MRREPLHPGSRLGLYEIVAPLGAGGMGEVWRARDPRLEREVALKVLPPAVAEDPERLARFEREAKALAALSHPGIVTVHSIEEDDGRRFVTMELVEGTTLEHLIAPGGMPLERVLDIAIALADSLAAAHARGILHRDIKPANVMVTPEGRVKLLDFGLAKVGGVAADDPLTAEARTLEGLTRDGQLLGTAPYLAPEQVRGKPVDFRSDVFSLGAVLYEMVTGRRTFTGDSAAELLSAILRDEPVSACDLRPELPRQLGRILRHCLAKDAERRFQSAKDLRNELEQLRDELAETRRTAGEEAGRRNAVAAGTLAAAAGTVDPARRRRLSVPAALAALVLAVSSAVVLVLTRPDLPSPATPGHARARTALAVLPFENLSADPADAYFAGGLHDELLTQLAKVAALSLRGRASVMGYATASKPIRQIAEELKVGAIVEGSVQVIGNRLRVRVQLIDAATDEHLWAETYDRTLDDAFAIQSDVAQRVVEAVGAALGASEQEALAMAPTANAEAYRLYLQGLEYFRRPGVARKNLEIAQQLLERALALDPEFALAHAALSEVHGAMHWFRYDPAPARLAAQRDAAEAALRRAPELPQARVAMAQWHYYSRDYATALAELEPALRAMPNDARLVELVGYVHRRQGNWDEALATFARAAELDPRYADLMADLGGLTLMMIKRYAEALEQFDRALALAPDLHWAAVQRGWVHVRWKGELGPLRAALDGITADAELGWLGSGATQRALLLLLQRRAGGLLEHLDEVEPSVLEAQPHFLPKPLLAAWAHRLRGDEEAAREAFRAAVGVLDEAVVELPDDPRVHAARGMALAGLRRRAEALEEARWLERVVDAYRLDAMSGPILDEDRARILAQAGAADGALDEIERLLAIPSRLTVHVLRLDPDWDPIRDHPRFRALMARFPTADP